MASFGAHLIEKEVITMSVAPRDSFKAQIQFALERGLPAFVGMLATQRLPLPSLSFDLIHCSRCLVPFAGFSMSSILTFLFCTYGMQRILYLVALFLGTIICCRLLFHLWKFMDLRWYLSLFNLKYEMYLVLYCSTAWSSAKI